jgi:N-methylhydantoinase A
VGAGGGSIAWIDGGSRLRVGPRSASSYPGPACYGHGGTEPTVTDANLICGRLPTQHFPKNLHLDEEAADRVIEGLAKELEITSTRLALGILRLAELSMAAVVRRQTLERGRDPRDFALIASGGAGPMHACAVAAEVGIPEVIVPSHPGHFSAIGMLLADLRFDRTRQLLMPLRDLDPAWLETVIDELSGEIAALMRTSTAAGEVVFSYSLSLRYRGQHHSLEIAGPSPVDATMIDEISRRFEDEYRRRYGHLNSLDPIEAVELQVIGARRLPRPRLAAHASESTGAGSQARAYFGLDETPVAVTVWERANLGEGTPIPGPAIICEPGATTLIPPDASGTVLADGSIRIRI